MSSAAVDSIIPRLRHEVALAVLQGHDVHQINEEIIEPAPLDDEHKAALFLYAFAMQDPGQSRQQAVRMLDELVDIAG